MKEKLRITDRDLAVVASAFAIFLGAHALTQHNDIKQLETVIESLEQHPEANDQKLQLQEIRSDKNRDRNAAAIGVLGASAMAVVVVPKNKSANKKVKIY
jgi:hypothetical protein